MAIEKLSKLAPSLFGKKHDNPKAAVKSLEAILPISKKYRKLLLAFGGPIWFDNGARYKPEVKNPLTSECGYNSIDFLYGLGSDKNSITQVADKYADELPKSFVPIGEAPGGNLICVNGKGAVHFWDHESPRNGPTWRIAASIDEFLNLLEPDESGSGNTDGIIVSGPFFDL